jgi:hypothetical protein
VPEEDTMYAVVRQYRGADELFEALARRWADVEEVLRGVPGFVAYTLIRATSGGVTVTLCEDRAGAEESTRRAAAWVRREVPNASWSPPEVTEGEVLYQFGPCPSRCARRLPRPRPWRCGTPPGLNPEADRVLVRTGPGAAPGGEWRVSGA